MAQFEILLGELKEFKRATLTRLDKLEMHALRAERFRWKVAGGAAVISAVITTAVQFLIRK